MITASGTAVCVLTFLIVAYPRSIRIFSQATYSNVYELVGLPKGVGSEVKGSSADGKRGGGSSVVFVARKSKKSLNKLFLRQNVVEAGRAVITRSISSLKCGLLHVRTPNSSTSSLVLPSLLSFAMVRHRKY